MEIKKINLDGTEYEIGGQEYTAGEGITIENGVISAVGGSGGGSQLYKHCVKAVYEFEINNTMQTLVREYDFISNVNETFSLNNVASFVNKYFEKHNGHTTGAGVTLDVCKTFDTNNHLELHKLYVQNGRYPGDTSGTRYIKIDYVQIDGGGTIYSTNIAIDNAGTVNVFADGLENFINITNLIELTDIVIPL